MEFGNANDDTQNTIERSHCGISPASYDQEIRSLCADEASKEGVKMGPIHKKIQGM